MSDPMLSRDFYPLIEEIIPTEIRDKVKTLDIHMAYDSLVLVTVTYELPESMIIAKIENLKLVQEADD